MLHCPDTSGGSCSNMSVLERQRARIKWQQHHQPTPTPTATANGVGVLSCCPQVQGSIMIAADHAHSIKPDPAFQNGWPRMGFGPPAPALDVNDNAAISRTCSCPPALPDPENVNSSTSTGKKRKADNSYNTKVVADSDNKDKKIKVGDDDGESKITAQTTAKNNKDTSNQNSKPSEIQKPDYIHVRARRGQATDSHSLAERVRREKISERMKYLQDLVPGCNKITGKAGMLDEIINYVQSLQRQVEFLSMKLAAVNPSLDFHIDDLFAKEVFPTCAASFPTTGMSSNMTDPAFLHFSSSQQIVSCVGLDTGINTPDMGLRRTISAPVSMPEAFLDSSSFTQILPSSTWEDFQNLYNVAFDQARATSFPSHLFTGLVEASNLKMEM